MGIAGGVYAASADPTAVPGPVTSETQGCHVTGARDGQTAATRYTRGETLPLQAWESWSAHMPP